MALASGTVVGRYRIVRLIAQGGMAEVYRADQDLTGGITRPAAVKVIRPEYSESEDFREMFLDEARTACTLSHQNIVHIYEVGETDDGLLYMAMELVAGETLAKVNRSLREKEERFSDEALFAIGISACSALEAVHALKVEGGTVNLVHRDVSPHNLLLSSKGGLKLIDFGIAKAATNRNLTMPGVTKGKAGYFSPEQAMGKSLDGRSDVFSLGVTLYKLASGHTPFDEHTNHSDRHAALVRGKWAPLSQAFPGLTPGLYDVVDSALKLKPELRFQTAQAMREALEKAAFDSGIRISQSSLLGYVDDQGAVTAEGGHRSPSLPLVAQARLPTAAQAKAASRAAPTKIDVPTRAAPATGVDTARTEPGAKGGLDARRLLLYVAFPAAVVIGVFATLMAFEQPSDAPAASLVATVAPVVVKATEVIEGPDASVPDEVAVDAGVAVAPGAAPPRIPPRPRPVPVVAKPPESAAIPAGEGKLRIDVRPAGAASAVLVNAENWGDPPLNRRVSSGVYKLVVKLRDGRTSSGSAPVWPDQTTTVIFDAQSQRWAVSR